RGYRYQGSINLYYPYFGICLLAASATGGNSILFLALTAGLVALFLGTVRSRHFGPELFYSFIALALMLSMLAASQFEWLQASLKRKAPDLKEWVIHLATLPDKVNPPHSEMLAHKGGMDKLDPNLEHTPLTPELDITPPPQTVSPAPQPSLNNAQLRANAVEQQAMQAENGTIPQQPNSASGTQPLPSSSPSPQTQAIPQQESQASKSATGTSQQSPEVNPRSGSNTTVASLPNTNPSQGAPQGRSVNSLQSSGASLIGNASINAASSGQGDNQSTGGTNGTRIIGAQGVDQLIQQGEGAANPQQSWTQIGQSGRLQLSDAILFRVDPNPSSANNRFASAAPLYIREATYNAYRSGVWDAADSRFTTAQSSSNQRWILGPQTSQNYSLRISTQLSSGEGVLKLPVGTSSIDGLPVASMQVNQYGTVAVQGQPGAVAYTVQFDPTQSRDGFPSPMDREIPLQEQATIQRILRSLNLEGKSDQEIVATIAAFFQNNFRYSLQLPQSQNGESSLSSFFQTNRAGHCEYFASATTLLLRAAGIPARYTVGYLVDEYSPTEQQYVVRARNAHAWTMAYVGGAWRSIDTTPADSSGPAEGRGQRAEERGLGNSNISAFSQQQPGETAINSGQRQSEKGQGRSLERTATRPFPRTGENNATSSQSSSPLPDAGIKKNQASSKPIQTSFTKEFSQWWSSLSKALQEVPQRVSETKDKLLSQLPKPLDALLGPVLILASGLAIIFASIFFVWRVLRRRNGLRRKPRRKGALINAAQLDQDSLPTGLDSEFYILEQRLAERGLARQPSETVRQWMLRLRQKLSESQVVSLNQIIDLHYRYRFDPQGLSPVERTTLRSMIQQFTWEHPVGEK
ncbi:MAG TPA: transglutaminase domain-containing protein, partial [Stenomitos sp.]